MCPVLIVDDSSILRNALKSFLRMQFPSVPIEEASSGEQALSAFRKTNPFLVFMDINLPDASGLDLTRTLKDSNSEVEVIIFTNHDGPEYREAAVHSGASHFVTKWDIRIDEITSLVASALSAWNRKCQTDAVSARCCT